MPILGGHFHLYRLDPRVDQENWDWTTCQGASEIIPVAPGMHQTQSGQALPHISILLIAHASINALVREFKFINNMLICIMYFVVDTIHDDKKELLFLYFCGEIKNDN